MRATYIMSMAASGDPDVTYGVLSMAFLSDGLLSWTILDDAGSPVPCNEGTLRSGALDWETTLAPIANRAAVLYTDSVVNPLRTGRTAPLQDGQTEESISQTNGSSSPSPTPSEPSTTPITPPSRPTGTPIGIGSSI
jgi:hypothetical protein